MSASDNPPGSAAVALSPSLRRARVAVALAGFGAAVAQVVLIRELLVSSAGNELCIAAVLASWLLWSAAGAWIGGQVVSRSRWPALTHIALLAAVEAPVLGLGLVLSRAGLHVGRGVFGGALQNWGLVPPQGGTLSLPQLLLLATAVTAPAGLLLGWQFAAGCRLLETTSGPRSGPALAYVFDSLGHLCGGAILAIAPVTRVPGEWLLLGGWVLVSVGAGVLRPDWRLAGVLAGWMVLIAGGAGPVGSHALPLRWAPYRLAASRDGPLGNVSVLEGAGGELAFFQNGALAFETGPVLAGEQWVHIPLLAHPSPKHVLLIGGGPRTVREVLRHRPETVSYFEIDPTLISAIRRHAPADLRRVLDDPRVSVQITDARLRLRALQHLAEPFDVVLVALADPTTAQINRYYTLEWFRQVARVMSADSVLAFQAMSSPDYLGSELRSYDACLFHTARRAGFEVRIFPGPHMVMACVLAGEPAAKRWAIFDSIPALERLIRSRGMDAPTLVGAFYDALDPFRREDRTRDLEDTRGVRLNRDFSPTCYYYAQVLWASWWRGGAAATLRLAQRLRVWHLLAATVLLTALAGAVSRLRRRPRRLIAPYAVLVAGAGGMTLEVVLLLGLQSLYGYVYGVIGYVVGMLMLGLAVGAWSAQRHVTEANARRALGSSQLGLVAAGGLSLAGLLGLQAALQAAPMGGLLPIAAISALMAATGVAVGAAFPSALALVGERQRGIAPATALYATDLVGACGGAILAGLVLVPLLGVVATCAAVMMLAAGAALLAFTAPGHRR